MAVEFSTMMVTWASLRTVWGTTRRTRAGPTNSSLNLAFAPCSRTRDSENMDLQHSQKTAKSAHSNESVIYCIENLNNLVLNHCVITSFWLVCESNTALLPCSSIDLQFNSLTFSIYSLMSFVWSKWNTPVSLWLITPRVPIWFNAHLVRVVDRDLQAAENLSFRWMFVHDQLEAVLRAVLAVEGGRVVVEVQHTNSDRGHAVVRKPVGSNLCSLDLQ